MIGWSLAAVLVTGADWPQWLGPNRDGITSARVAAWPPVTLWKASVGLGYTSPVVAGGRIYCRNNRGEVVCLDVAAEAD